MRNNLVLIAALLFLRTEKALGMPHGAPYKLDLDMPIASATVKGVNAFYTLTLLSMNGVVVAGEFEDDASPLFSFSLDGQALHTVLDEIVRQAPAYTWTADGGIIRIFLKDAAKRRALSALETKVPEFASSELSVTGTILRLATAARDKGARVFGKTQSESEIKRSMDLTPTDALVTVRIRKGITLRAGLDEIVTSDPPAMWITKLGPDGRLLIAGQSTHQHLEESPVNRRLRDRGPLDPRALPGKKQTEQSK